MGLFYWLSEGAVSVTKHEIYEAYLQWLGDDKAKPFSDLFKNSFADCNVFEDADYLVNRLFYAVPAFSNGLLRCFIFFEENKLKKDKQGDLLLVSSSWHIQQNN